jgi:predicted kinase
MEKEKITDKQFFLIINGPSCGGKSAVADALHDKYEGIFNAKSDRIKWLISDYNSSKHRGVVHEIVLEALKVALKNGLSVIKEGAIWKPEELIGIAEDYKAPLFIVNVSAPEDVLEKRFQERVEKKKLGAQIANVDPERFRELNKMYLDSKMETPLEFDSSTQAASEMVEKIISHIRKNI